VWGWEGWHAGDPVGAQRGPSSPVAQVEERARPDQAGPKGRRTGEGAALQRCREATDACTRGRSNAILERRLGVAGQ